MLSTIVLAFLLPVQPQVSFGVGVDVQVEAPTVQFDVEPPLVVVSPGVMVVRDCDSEVFFVNGFYWTSTHGVWYRARSHRGGWVAMPGRRVPHRIAYAHPGAYRHFRGGRPYVRRSWHRDRRDGHRGPGRYERRNFRDHRDHRGDGGYRHSGRGDRHRGRR